MQPVSAAGCGGAGPPVRSLKRRAGGMRQAHRGAAARAVGDARHATADKPGHRHLHPQQHARAACCQGRAVADEMQRAAEPAHVVHRDRGALRELALGLAAPLLSRRSLGPHGGRAPTPFVLGEAPRETGGGQQRRAVAANPRATGRQGCRHTQTGARIRVARVAGQGRGTR